MVDHSKWMEPCSHPRLHSTSNLLIYMMPVMIMDKKRTLDKEAIVAYTELFFFFERYGHREHDYAYDPGEI